MLVIEWSLVLPLRWRSLGELSPFDIYMELGGLWWTSVLNLALPPQRHKADTRPEHQDPVSHMAQKIREKQEWMDGWMEGRKKSLK